MPAFEKETLEKQALTFSLGEVSVIIFCHFILGRKKQTPSNFAKKFNMRIGGLIFLKSYELHTLQHEYFVVCFFF